MKFPIAVFFELTTFWALSSLLGPWVGFLAVHAGAVLMPLGIAFTAILTSKAENQQLVLKENKAVALMVRVWAYCLLTVILFWLWGLAIFYRT